MARLSAADPLLLKLRQWHIAYIIPLSSITTHSPCRVFETTHYLILLRNRFEKSSTAPLLSSRSLPSTPPWDSGA